MNKIKEYQKNNGLVPDGLIGRITLLSIKTKLGIKTNEELAHFMGQTDHESGHFTADTENLNYSASGLMTVFKKYFPTKEIALKYERKPIEIASKVYASRMGNGDEASKEGWKFRGRGALQLTGKNNYKLFGMFLNKPEIMDNPETVANEYFFESAAFFFNRNNLWKYCTKVDEQSIKNVTLRVNGGTNGLDDRIVKTLKYYNILK